MKAYTDQNEYAIDTFGFSTYTIIINSIYLSEQKQKLRDITVKVFSPPSDCSHDMPRLRSRANHVRNPLVNTGPQQLQHLALTPLAAIIIGLQDTYCVYQQYLLY